MISTILKIIFFTQSKIEGADKAQILQQIIRYLSNSSFKYCIGNKLIEFFGIDIDDVNRVQLIYLHQHYFSRENLPVKNHQSMVK